MVSSHTTPRSVGQNTKLHLKVLGVIIHLGWLSLFFLHGFLHSCSHIKKPLCTFISHIVYLIKDDPGHFSHNFRATVQHAAQNLCVKTTLRMLAYRVCLCSDNIRQGQWKFIEHILRKGQDND